MIAYVLVAAIAEVLKDCVTFFEFIKLIRHLVYLGRVPALVKPLIVAVNLGKVPYIVRIFPNPDAIFS